MKCYMMTDAFDDLIGSTNRAEELFIANTLADAIHEFVLRTNVQWIGASKWIVRALNQFDENFARTFVQAFDVFYKTGNKDAIIDLADEVLKPYGGRLFEGYSYGERESYMTSTYVDWGGHKLKLTWESRSTCRKGN